MKKLIAILICCLVPLISACDFLNGPYRKRMLEYYSVDSNYVNNQFVKLRYQVPVILMGKLVLAFRLTAGICKG